MTPSPSYRFAITPIMFNTITLLLKKVVFLSLFLYYLHYRAILPLQSINFLYCISICITVIHSLPLSYLFFLLTFIQGTREVIQVESVLCGELRSNQPVIWVQRVHRKKVDWLSPAGLYSRTYTLILLSGRISFLRFSFLFKMSLVCIL